MVLKAKDEAEDACLGKSSCLKDTFGTPHPCGPRMAHKKHHDVVDVELKLLLIGNTGGRGCPLLPESVG